MKFNPLTNELYSDEGQFLKQLSCPFHKNWEDLETISNSSNRICNACNLVIIDTSTVNDDELIKLLEENKNTCLKIDLNTVKIFTNGAIKQR